MVNPFGFAWQIHCKQHDHFLLSWHLSLRLCQFLCILFCYDKRNYGDGHFVNTSMAILFLLASQFCYSIMAFFFVLFTFHLCIISSKLITCWHVKHNFCCHDNLNLENHGNLKNIMLFLYILSVPWQFYVFLFHKPF